jgi:hypothetical protein
MAPFARFRSVVPLAVPGIARRSTGRAALLALLLSPVIAGSRVSAAPTPTISWDGGAGTTAWADANNWSTNTLPTATDVVAIGAAFNVTSSGPVSIASLQLGGTLSITGGMFSVSDTGANGSIINGTLNLTPSGTGGGLSGAGDLVVNGTLTWTSGDMGGSGTTTIGSGGTLNFGGTPISLSGSRLLHNDGTATFLGVLSFSDSAALQNGGTLTVGPGGSGGFGAFTSVGTVSGTQVTNTGTLTVKNVAFGSQLQVQVAFANSGGTLEVDAGSSGPGGAILLFDRTGTAKPTFSGTSLIKGTGTVKVTGDLEISGGTTTIDGPTTAMLTPSGTGGGLSGAGDLVVNGTLTWTSGDMGGSGTTTIGSGGTLNFGGTPISLSGSRLLHNDGTATFLGVLSFSDSAALQNGGTLTVGPGGSGGFGAFTSVGTVSGTQVTNTGTLTVKNVAFGSQLQVQVAFANSGGTLEVDAGSSGPGGAILLFDRTGTAKPTFSGTSLIKGTGTVKVTGDLEISGGTTTIDGPTTVELAPAATTVGPVSGGGSITLKGTLSAFNAPTVSTSLFNDGGTIKVNNGATLNLTGTFPNYSASTKTLTGGTYVVIASPLAGTLKFTGADIATNAASIVLDGTASAIVSDTGADALPNLATITSAGSLEIKNGRLLSLAHPLETAGHVTVGVNSAFTAVGNYHQTAGATTLSATTATLTASGAEVVIDAGDLAGIGTVAPKLQSSGHVKPGLSPGTLHVAGSYIQLPTGSLDIDIAGTTAGSGFDRLDVLGAAQLAGTLNITTAGSFTPVAGNVFEFLDSGLPSGVTGTFDAVTGFDAGGGKWYEVRYAPAYVDLLVHAPPVASIDDVSVTEGNAGTTTATFTVTLSEATPLTVTIHYATSDGTAIAPADYLASSGTLTFVPQDTSESATVSVVGDALDEFDETYTVDLATPMNATIGDGQGTGTIIDDDPPPTVSINDVSVNEGNAGMVTATFTVSLSTISAKPITVDYATADNTAVQPDDYAASTGTLTFNPGDTTKTIDVGVAGDTLDELDETFFVNLSTPSNVTIADGQGSGTIVDDDSPVMTVGNVTVVEGTGGSTVASFPVSLSVPSSFTVSVHYSTADGTAIQPGDYMTASGTFALAPGVISGSINVNINPDTIDEIDETFLLNVSNPVNVTLANGQATATIQDDDPAPTLSIADASFNEGNSGSSNGTFTVSLSSASSKTITVDYATSDGSAVAPVDYAATIGTLTFNPGDTTRPVVVPITGDTLDESDETFLVALSNPMKGAIGDGQATGTIVDDDSTPAISIGDASIAEGNCGTTILHLPVTLSAASARTVTVNFASSDGSATAPSDYATASGIVTFPAGTTSASVDVTVNGDTQVEPDETLAVDLATPTNATIADGHAVGTIVNDDQPSEGILFVSNRDGNSEIYIMNANGSGQARLTTNPASDTLPSWSPDHTKIVFVSTRDGNSELYVMNANGCGQTRLTANGAIDTTPAWSPDGLKIAFASSRTGNGDIYVMNSNGIGTPTRLTTNSAIEDSPAWSPSGQKVAFGTGQTGNGDVYVMNANGTGIIRLTAATALDSQPAWSRDGTKIAFSSARTGSLDVFVMNANGTSQTRLTISAASDGEPAYTADGSHILFSTSRDGNFEIYSMNANGTGQTRLTVNPASDTSPRQ